MLIFRESKLRKEFDQLHPALQKILYWLSGWAERNTSAKNIEITHLFRTQAEQDDIYGDNDDYRLHPWKSVHQYSRGADISVRSFRAQGDDPELICSLINTEFPYGDGKHRTALYHQVGNRGKHIHLQVRG